MFQTMGTDRPNCIQNFLSAMINCINATQTTFCRQHIVVNLINIIQISLLLKWHIIKMDFQQLPPTDRKVLNEQYGLLVLFLIGNMM